MLTTYPQFSPQPLMATPFGAALFAPTTVPAGSAFNSFFGHEPGFAGFAQPSQVFAPFAPYAASQPFTQPYAMTPFLQSPAPVQAAYAVAQQLVLALGQLAQQISTTSVVNQQIAVGLQQLTQQIQAHTLPGLAGLAIGQPYAQPYAQIGSPFAGATSPFIGTPGLYPGAWQAWGGQRPQTIQ